MASGDSLAIFTPLHNEPHASSPATLDTRNSHPVIDFDAAANEYSMFSSVMPRAYGNSGVTIYPHVAFTSATTGSAVFYMAVERIGDGQQDMDSDGFATAASVIVGAPATAEAAVEAVRRLNAQVGIPQRLSQVGVTETFIPQMAQDAYESGNAQVANPRKPSYKEVVELFRQAL